MVDKVELEKRLDTEGAAKHKPIGKPMTEEEFEKFKSENPGKLSEETGFYLIDKGGFIDVEGY